MIRFICFREVQRRFRTVTGLTIAEMFISCVNFVTDSKHYQE